MPLNGWIILDKPLGLGSTQAVGAVKRALREAGKPKTKVGHGGTLDPLATGVLPIALGEATKLAGRTLDATKAYDFTIRFGEETDTLDCEGTVKATSHVLPSEEAIRGILVRFTGPLEQVPPAYSALKVDGKRAYDLARAGEEVSLKTRNVTIDNLELLESGENNATFSATVSKGTYIRSLARDIARALGTVGHVTMLRRTKAGPFSLKQAISLDKLADIAKARFLDEVVLPLEAGLDDIPALPVTPEQARLLRYGQSLVGIPVQPGLHLAKDGDVPVALVEAEGGAVRVVRGFNI
ncbi:tRNA pseudouridine(55) synthase TruB [Sphingomonas sp. HDW15A]|uniref:tRNA pseudouridine(55) synthase TruB n=1 Tax=Sphingomonas sp. HDW15A TaxID=2714942 RepID=UPI0014094B80|nr:tRNA pseudouridine(55) synthase TruB [Sphingomonas sp. HDW15A]QIK95412.1 tRNA pseudouridine(55) synthase TruB [Sphingomonas sp. HDW15A]